MANLLFVYQGYYYPTPPGQWFRRQLCTLLSWITLRILCHHSSPTDSWTVRFIWALLPYLLDLAYRNYIFFTSSLKSFFFISVSLFWWAYAAKACLYWAGRFTLDTQGCDTCKYYFYHPCFLLIKIRPVGPSVNRNVE